MRWLVIPLLCCVYPLTGNAGSMDHVDNPARARINYMLNCQGCHTAGGIAPCLSSSIGALLESYNTLAPDADMIGYLNGYQGLLLGKSIAFSDAVKKNYAVLYEFGGPTLLVDTADAVVTLDDLLPGAFGPQDLPPPTP